MSFLATKLDRLMRELMGGPSIALPWGTEGVPSLLGRGGDTVAIDREVGSIWSNITIN